MSKWALDAKIMRLRGLGYTHKEISKKLKIKEGTVGYKLSQLKKQAEKEGINTVFFENCVKLYIPTIMRFFK